MDGNPVIQRNDRRYPNFVKMNLTRKCLTAVMLTLIMMPAIYSVYFHVRQQLIRLEMWEWLEGEGDDVVIIHPSKLYWMEKDREIFVNGMMFDVKSIEKVGDSLRITGEYDFEESGIHRQMEKVQESREDEDQQSNSIQVLTQVMDDSMSRFLTSLFPFELSDPKQLPLATTLPIVYLNTISPPPKS